MSESQGHVKISDDVVATIAGLAALEIDGIAAMSGGISEGFAKKLSGKQIQRGVSVEVGQLEAAIDLRVLVKYGTIIHEVCRSLQTHVKDAVQSMTGLNVVEVNIQVDGVIFEQEKEETTEVQRVR